MKNKILLACALALGMAFVHPTPAAAQTTSAYNRTKLADNITLIRTETIATRDQLQATVNALNALTKQSKGDLQPTFNAYAAEVAKTHTAADQTAARIVAMQAASKEYFGGWQEKVSSISNESLQKKAQKRMDAVVKNYNGVIASLTAASDKFKPFLSNLDDVQKMLASDVTPGGVKAVRGVASDANWNMKKVRSSIYEAIDDLESMAKSLSSQAKD
jgi:hypothetical protein